MFDAKVIIVYFNIFEYFSATDSISSRIILNPLLVFRFLPEISQLYVINSAAVNLPQKYREDGIGSSKVLHSLL